VWLLVPRLGVPLALWCIGSLFTMDFPFVSKKRNMMGGQLGLYKISLYSKGKDATIKSLSFKF
jgi:hypothetical protein